jgi:hypothetical protein
MLSAIALLASAVRASLDAPGVFMPFRRHILLVAGALVGLAMAGAAWPARQACAQDSCADSCRVAYGNCYKRTQNREQCQQQWKRCLDQCRNAKR